MKKILQVEGMSQYHASIDTAYHSSACGPVTAYIIARELGKEQWTVNDFYRQLKGTRIGLFTHRMIRYMQRFLGPSYDVQRCSLKEALSEIDQGRIVAMKFDKYFSFRWFGTFSFSYHWVPLIGYELEQDQLYLYIHDNGGRNRNSRVRKIPYGPNHEIITFIRFTPLN
ncbi:hypothetical protein ACFO0S_08665 [Chryseomicrobium palamuruense]|uniref:Peptidase C39-like domain-containing protein n=1 Tax=Chryseomicrobium palamuruense TaxID=682973 RepID=A0ABV8UUV1_9BACL